MACTDIQKRINSTTTTTTTTKKKGKKTGKGQEGLTELSVEAHRIE
jgi:hypothetical protein